MALVAVVDSGVGGLTVLKSLVANNPDGDFVYLGDHAFCPYGTKRPAVVKERVISVCRYLNDVGAEQIVLACNTASLFANAIRKEIKLPVFDVIYPTCVEARETTRTGKIVLLATSVTVNCGTYAKILDKMGVKTVSSACDEFVTLVEKRSANAQLIVKNKLADLHCTACDTVILGCTHFPYLYSYIQNCFPRCKIVTCSNALTEYFSTSGSGRVVCYTTGDEKTATLVASQFGFTFEHLQI